MFRPSERTIVYRWKFLKTGNTGVKTCVWWQIPEVLATPWKFRTFQSLIDHWNSKSPDWQYELLGELTKPA